MARKRGSQAADAAAAAARAAVEATERVDSEIELEPELSDDPDVLAALAELDESGTDIQWSVTKLTGPPDEKGFIDTLSSAHMSRQYFRDTYGPGEYRVVGRKDGVYFKGGHKKIRISKVGYTGPQRGSAAGADTVTSTKDILALMEAKAAESRAELKSWAQLLTPLLAPVVVAWLKPRENQVTELVQGLAALKGLTPEAPKPEPFDAQLDRLAGAIGKLKEIAGDEKGSTGATWVDIVRDGISALKEPAAALASRFLAPGNMPAVMGPQPMLTAPSAAFTPVAPAGSSAAQPSAPPVQAPAASNGSGNVGMIQLATWFANLLPDLIYQAKRNKDPALYAEVTTDNIPDGTDPATLKAFIERPDWWAQLQVFAPGVAAYPAWFTDYRTEVLKLLTEALKPPPPEAAPDPPQEFSPNDTDGMS
jgi:hypothetical protein